jgi:hypothetical protein
MRKSSLASSGVATGGVDSVWAAEEDSIVLVPF